jgi:replicative DNA helicase
MESKEQLHDELCEQCVIGTLLSDRNALNEVREYLTTDCFYSRQNANIYDAICAMADNGESPDIITIIPELKKMGCDITPAELCEITSRHTFDVTEYAIRLSDLNKRRQLANLGLYLYSNGTEESNELNEVISDTETRFKQIQGESVTHIQDAGDLLPDVDKRINDLRNGITPEYTHTGFKELDKHRQLQPSSLIIVAADSSQGKTSFANCITLSAAANGCPIAFYSMEMTADQQLTRLASIESDIPYGVLFNRPLNDIELSTYQSSRDKIAGLPIYFDDRSTSNIDTIITSIRTMVIKYHIGGVIIDYLQILNVNTRTNSTEQQLAEIARRLKNLAKQLNIWIMLLSQLSRNLENPEPTLDRLRGSGQINEAADTTILIYRPEFYNTTYGKNLHYSGAFKSVNTTGTAIINIAKGRNTGTYNFVCGFNGQCMRFYDLNDIPTLTPEMQPEDDEPF